VADIDGDGSAEILTVNNDYAVQGHTGITVFGHASDGWPRSGPTWHAHDFAVTNIEADGAVPALPDPPWQEHNVFRARPASDGWSPLPDLTVELTDLCVASCEEGPVKVSFQVFNQGTGDAAGSGWAFYKKEVGQAVLVTSGQLGAISAGSAASGITIELQPGDIGDQGFVLRVDDDGSGLGHVDECYELNNRYAWGDAICG